MRGIVAPDRGTIDAPSVYQRVVSAPMLILALVIGGIFVGWIAQLLLGRRSAQVDWAMALIAGIVGSFVGGLLFSLLAGDGLAIAPSGLIGSLIGAVIVTAVWQAVAKKQRSDERASAAGRRRR
jgi:uncharacterized membrane protein YeaQ/YmgE (transglycosylase-associated protein family)